MSGFFPPSLLEQIRAASDIVEVIGAVVPLKRAGTNFVGLCPFHREKSPSFNVSPQKQMFHCFGCGKGGNVYTFVREFENLSFPEAVRRLAERARIPIDTVEAGSAGADRSLKELLYQIHEGIAKRWEQALETSAGGEIGRAYLAKRGVSAEAVKLFRIGYSPDAWDDTVNWSKGKGYAQEVVEQAGLVIRKEGETRCYDRFRGRLMFPICDEQGRVVAFSGRVLNGDEKTAKYVNSPETPIFTKGRIFFGLDKSKRAILEARTAVVCEGQLDLIACYMAGVRNIVAPQGTAFTADHARILKRYADEVILCFDSDNAGQNAAVRVLDLLLEAGLSIKVAAPPPPHDPDSYIKEFGAEAFQKVIGQAVGFFDFYLNRLCQTNDLASDKGRVTVVRSMAEALHKASNNVLLDRYAQKTAQRLGVSADSVRAEFKKRPRPPGPQREENDIEHEEAAVEAPRPSVQELWLLKVMIHHAEALAVVADTLDPAWLQSRQVRQIVEEAVTMYQTHRHLDTPNLLDAFEDEAVRRLIAEAATESRPIPQPERQARDIVLNLRNQALDRRIADLSRQLAGEELTDTDRLEIFAVQQELRQARKQPLDPREPLDPEI